MNLEDIVHLRLKVRQDSARTNSTELMRKQMRDWNKIDTELYNHFEKVLQKKVLDFTVENGLYENINVFRSNDLEEKKWKTKSPSLEFYLTRLKKGL